MIDQPSKHPWHTPQLILLVRGTPEEAVLVACKLSSEIAPHSGPGVTYSGCLISYNSPGGGPVTCDNPCSTTLAS